MSDPGGDDEAGSWLTVGARPRRRAAPSAATAASAGPPATDRRDRRNNGTTARPSPDWHLVMRSRQAITKLRDQDFALTRLGQINHSEARAARADSARNLDWRDKSGSGVSGPGRSRLGAKFPSSAAPERSRRPALTVKKHSNPVMPRFDVPLNSDADFPSLAGDSAATAGSSAPAERRRASVALKLDQSLRSMAQQSRAMAAAAPVISAVVTVEALPPPVPPPPRVVAYSDAVSRPRSAKALRKSERRDLVREDIREDVEMLQSSATAGVMEPSTPPQPPPAAGTPAKAEAQASTPPTPRSKEKEKRAMKKAKKKESQLILARMNANKDTHVQLVTAHEFRRLHGSHAGRRRAPAEAVDLRAPDQYPSLQESLPAKPVDGEASKETSLRHQATTKSYSRMLRELPKKPSVTTESAIQERVSAEDAADAKKKTPKKKAPIELSLMDLAELKSTARQRRQESAREEESDGRVVIQRRTVQRAGAVGGNQLDSTPVVRHRGKTRPDGKKKKLSLLKRVILRERTERRKRRSACAAAAARAGTDATAGQANVARQSDDGGDCGAASPAELAGSSEQPAAISGELAAGSDAEEQTEVDRTTSLSAAVSLNGPTAATPDDETVPEDMASEVTKGQTAPCSSKDNRASRPSQSPAQLDTGQGGGAAPEPVSADQGTAGDAGGAGERPADEVVVEPGSDDDEPPSRGPAYQPTLSVDPKLLLHSRQFREYCQQTLSPEIDETARLLLQDLTRFQDRLYNRDPIKARSRRRLVIGLREVSKQLAIKPLQCVILAPNIEKIESAGGLDQAVRTLLSRASERAVPLVCALKRRALGHACKKPVPVSCVGVYNYQGSEDNFKRLMQLTEVAQDTYRERLRTVERALAPEPARSAASQLLNVFDRISDAEPSSAPAAVTDDPTVSLLAKLRAVALSAAPEVSG